MLKIMPRNDPAVPNFRAPGRDILDNRIVVVGGVDEDQATAIVVHQVSGFEAGFTVEGKAVIPSIDTAPKVGFYRFEVPGFVSLSAGLGALLRHCNPGVDGRDVTIGALL